MVTYLDAQTAPLKNTGDVLIVTKLDRLGRDAIDVSSTVKALAEIGVRVHCLALGGVDLASSAGSHANAPKRTF